MPDGPATEAAPEAAPDTATEATTDVEVEVDVVVVGLGAGGELVARKLAEAGLDVVGVERDLVGGECPFWGCTPSKLLIHSAHRRDDWSRAAARIREANHDWSDDHHAGPLERAGVRIVRGHGRLAGPRRVEVDGTTYQARRGVVLNPGTSPAVPPIDGLAGTPYWTNRDVMRQRERPASLAVLGAGPIGCELAQAFARFGTRVTLVEARDRILCPEEPEACAVVSAALAADGVEIRTAVEVSQVRFEPGGPGGAGEFRLIAGDDKAGAVVAERLLVATGRHTNLDDLGLETVGVTPTEGVLSTHDRMRVAPGLWAIGDVTGHGAYTHVSLQQGRVAVRDLLGQDGPWADHRAVSRVTFTDPEVGAVGMTEEQAREAGLRIAVGRVDLADSSRGWIAEAEGVVKVVADADRGVLVGGTIVAPYGGEALGLLTAAVHAEIPVAALREMPLAYPTFHRAITAALADLSPS